MTVAEFKRRMQADGWEVRKLKRLEMFEISADRVPTFHVTLAEVRACTDIGMLIAEKLRPAINAIFEKKESNT